jgi:hypothetical protein
VSCTVPSDLPCHVRRARQLVYFAKQECWVFHEWRGSQRMPQLQGEEAVPDRVPLFESHSRKTSAYRSIADQMRKTSKAEFTLFKPVYDWCNRAIHKPLQRSMRAIAFNKSYSFVALSRAKTSLCRVCFGVADHSLGVCPAGTALLYPARFTSNCPPEMLS